MTQLFNNVTKASSARDAMSPEDFSVDKKELLQAVRGTQRQLRQILAAASRLSVLKEKLDAISPESVQKPSDLDRIDNILDRIDNVLADMD